MSVSQPLAADGAHVGKKGDASRAGQHEHSASGTHEPAGPSKSAGANHSASEYLIHAPAQLGLKTRMEFREVGSAVVDRIPTGAGRLVVDCSSLYSIDSSGLNALIILQRKAAAKRVPIVLKYLKEELLALLVLTKLDDLFEREDGQAR